MQRAFSRGHRPARTPFLASALTLAAVLASSAAAAQSMGGPVPYQPTDPWAGISIIVTPAQPDAGSASEANAVPTAPPRPADVPEAPEPQIADTPIEQWTPPSLYESLDLGLGELPAIEPEKPAPNTLLPARKPAVPSKTAKLPTKVEIDRGPASVSVSTNLSANAPVSSALTPSAGSGSGEVKGRVGYSMDNLSLYGAGQLGASASTGSPSVYDNYAVGSTYSVPLDNLGLGPGEKLGASVEVNNSSTVNTGVELRAPLGSYERFLSVQRSAPVDSTPSGVVKAGVLGRF